MKEIKILEDLGRIDSYLTKETGFSRSKIQKMLKEKYIMVNDKSIKSSYSLKPGDVIKIEEYKEPEMNLDPVNMNLDIVYEDDDVIVVNKANGVVVHPAVSNKSNTLVNGLLYHSNSLSDINGEFRPGIVHRIDAYTTGLLMVAKNNEAHASLAKQLEERGADNICLKDMANLLLPFKAYELVKALKTALKPTTKLHLHTHNTTGTGDMVYLMAILAGVDIVDTALSPLGNGTSQPATEPLVATLKGTPYDTGIDINKLLPIVKHFKTVEQRLKDDKILNEKSKGVDVNTLLYQVPGGMLSNLINQLEKAGKVDKLFDCLAEVPNVRKDCGYPPLVTPSSQIVGTQAVLNIVMGERYKMVTKETKDVIAGKYGTLPMPVDEAIAKKVLGDAERITCRPADLLQPEYEEIKKKVIELGYYEKEEDVLSYAVFEQVAENFFKWRDAQKKCIDRDLAKTGVYPV